MEVLALINAIEKNLQMPTLPSTSNRSSFCNEKPMRNLSDFSNQLARVESFTTKTNYQQEFFSKTPRKSPRALSK